MISLDNHPESRRRARHGDVHFDAAWRRRE